MTKKIFGTRLVALIFLIFTALCQSSGIVPAVFGAKAFLLLPALVCVAMFETEIAATGFGLFAGALWDYSSPFADGALTLFLGIAACCCAWAAHDRLRRNLSAAFFLGGVLSSLAAVVFTFLSGVPAFERYSVLMWFYLPSAVYSLAFVPLFYVIFYALYRNGNDERVI